LSFCRSSKEKKINTKQLLSREKRKKLIWKRKINRKLLRFRILDARAGGDLEPDFFFLSPSRVSRSFSIGQSKEMEGKEKKVPLIALDAL
jgi:hypothetical protein